MCRQIFFVVQSCLFHQETKWTTGQLVFWASFISCCCQRVPDSMGKPLSLPHSNDALEQLLFAGAVSFPYLAGCGTVSPLYTKIRNTEYCPSVVSLVASRLDPVLKLASQNNNFLRSWKSFGWVKFFKEAACLAFILPFSQVHYTSNRNIFSLGDTRS